MTDIAVLASTNGTDMQALIDNPDKIKATLRLVICNRQCGALERAKKHNIKAVLIESKGMQREEFDREVDKILEENNIDLILLIGYMRYLSKWFVNKWENKIMNIHPSLLPAFAGGMDLNVHEEVLKRGCRITGCTLHFVDEGQDTGPIILQEAIPVLENDTAETLKQKVQKLEQEIIIKAVNLFAENRLSVEDSRVRILDN